ncbi:zinc finger HIT domain-containing protein 2 [Cyprinodon tularosa]|uniref:zinc finger HIT domain-containing protein 2 n=1 Tax=Cyprinodon tularosa TaxID=77115 RepID=UPI0018E25393|nr:zinc finger HIT domain-containing protein 2 [Cyprinodon tularosa]
MNPVIRRSLPPSVRSLLTDIGPKEEKWADPEDEAVSRDGILVPSRGAGKEEFISPATIQKENTAEDQSNTRTSRAVCMLCNCKQSNYTCPRCNLQYCGLSCYQRPEHSACSEEFYKESVLKELKEMGKTEEEGKKKMQEILLGLRQKAEATQGGMEHVLKEADLVGEGEVQDQVQVLDLLSRLAEIQQSGRENIPEMEAILEKLEEIGGAEAAPGAAGEDTEGELDLAERLSGLDIDKLSEEELWELLGEKEQKKFLGLLKGGDLSGLVPLWRPWWEKHEEEGRQLVQVLQEEVNKQKDRDDQVSVSQGENQKGESAFKMNKSKGGKGKSKGSSAGGVPPISVNIPKLSSLCANPSPLVCYSIINALYGYAFSLSLFNGDTDSLMFEFCDMILALSEALSSGRVFSSVQDALDSGETLILRGGYLNREDPLAPARAVEAVAHILTGRDRGDPSGYCLAAFSQLRSTFSKARLKLSKEGDEGVRRHKYFQVGKKFEFFQAWVKDNAPQVQILAVELWGEHGKRESVRSSIKKTKTVVEENLKKEKRRRNDKLIEELS